MSDDDSYNSEEEERKRLAKEEEEIRAYQEARLKREAAGGKTQFKSSRKIEKRNEEQEGELCPYSACGRKFTSDA